jgi:hypothetical protein
MVHLDVVAIATVVGAAAAAVAAYPVIRGRRPGRPRISATMDTPHRTVHVRLQVRRPDDLRTVTLVRGRHNQIVPAEYAGPDLPYRFPDHGGTADLFMYPASGAFAERLADLRVLLTTSRRSRRVRVKPVDNTEFIVPDRPLPAESAPAAIPPDVPPADTGAGSVRIDHDPPTTEPPPNR